MVNPDMDDDSKRISMEIEECFEKWERMANEYGEEHFSYGERYMVAPPEREDGRLLKVYNTSTYDEAFNTMTSMRNVDISVRSSVLIWED